MAKNSGRRWRKLKEGSKGSTTVGKTVKNTQLARICFDYKQIWLSILFLVRSVELNENCIWISKVALESKMCKTGCFRSWVFCTVFISWNQGNDLRVFDKMWFEKIHPTWLWAEVEAYIYKYSICHIEFRELLNCDMWGLTLQDTRQESGPKILQQKFF